MQSTITSYDQLPIMLSAKNVANALGISESKAYELFRSKGFPVIVLGRRKLVAKDKLIEWLNKKANTETFDLSR